MSGKIITVAVAAILLGSIALASAQTQAFPRHNQHYWHDYGYYDQNPPVAFGFGVAPYGYYAPGYYYDYAPGYYDNWNNGWNNRWNNNWDDNW